MTNYLADETHSDVAAIESTTPLLDEPPARDATPRIDSLNAELWVDGDRTTVHVVGDVDIAAGPFLVALAERALERPRISTLVLDFTDVDFIDSSGVGSLITIRHRCSDSGVDFSLRALGPRVSRVLTITGMNSFFGVTELERAKR